MSNMILACSTCVALVLGAERSHPPEATVAPTSSKWEVHIPCGRDRNGKTWIPGVHYNLIYFPDYDILEEGIKLTLFDPKTQDGVTDSSAVPILPPKAREKVELLEINHYRGRSIRDNAAFREWLAQNEHAISYIYRPWVQFNHQRLQARMYFALETLARGDLHDELRKFIRDTRDQKRFLTLQEHHHPDKRATLRYYLDFVRQNGLDTKKVAELYNSKAAGDWVIQAEFLSELVHAVDGSPTYVINRRFGTGMFRAAEGRDDFGDKSADSLVELMRFLVESERTSKHLGVTGVQGGNISSCSR